MVAEFQTPVDIANRALQHLGAQRITSFTDVSLNAAEIASCYDKIRTAELRRNIWRFATRKATLRPIVPAFVPAQPYGTSAALPTLKITPGLYSPTVVYFPGEIVIDANGTWWQSKQDNNLGLVPGTGDTWDVYFGPMNATPWDTTGTTFYSVGEVVYLTPRPGVIEVYTALATGNPSGASTPDQANPAIATVYSLATAYFKGQVVQGSNGWFYMSLVDVNLGNDPILTVPQWQPILTYAKGALVTGLDSVIYQSQVNGNVGANPTSGGFPNAWMPTGTVALWTSSFVGGTGDSQWHRQANMQVAAVNWLSPLSSGPENAQAARNVYKLPNGYLRQAPDAPKQGAFSYLGGPSGRMPDDYMFEGGFFTSSLFGPILFRFVADVTLVDTMDPMFCEGLACSLALATCEKITQSTDKWQKCNVEYKRIMGEARLVNGIETGPVEPPEDEYVLVRQ